MKVLTKFVITENNVIKPFKELFGNNQVVTINSVSIIPGVISQTTTSIAESPLVTINIFKTPDYSEVSMLDRTWIGMVVFAAARQTAIGSVTPFIFSDKNGFGTYFKSNKVSSGTATVVLNYMLTSATGNFYLVWDVTVSQGSDADLAMLEIS